MPPATAQTFSISGTISGSGGKGATVSLSGATSATTTASSSGSYTFTGLANGTYAVTPSSSGFNFSPTTQSVTINGSNATVPAFTATVAPPTFSISGSITPAATGSGATVTLSGTASAAATANSSGTFTFTGLANGSYTVTPTSSSATFSPTSQNVTINGANGSVSFTATATPNVIFYDDFTEASLSSDWFALDVNANVNSQQECYLPSQVSLNEGYLNITATAQSATCSGTTKSYSSGAIVWSSFNFTYGTVEYRAKMPGGQGPWPAVWLLGSKCQPSSPTIYNASTCNWDNAGSEELDMTEFLDGNWTQDNENIWSSLVSSPSCTPSLTDASQNFHVYDTVWAAGSVKWYIDGTEVCSQTWTGSALSSPMYLIINIAMGGAGGSITNSTLPQTMQVQYVKVTQP